jgi:hypothetical protein
MYETTVINSVMGGGLLSVPVKNFCAGLLRSKIIALLIPRSKYLYENHQHIINCSCVIGLLNYTEVLAQSP